MPPDLTPSRFRSLQRYGCEFIDIEDSLWCRFVTMVEPPRMIEIRGLPIEREVALRHQRPLCFAKRARSAVKSSLLVRGFRRTARQFLTGCVSRDGQRTFPPQTGFAAERWRGKCQPTHRRATRGKMPLLKIDVVPLPIVSNLQQSVHLAIQENRRVKKLASATDPLWYKDAIIYELHVRAFSDSNGDGIGDFPGLLSRLDYLQDLGVTCIWLLPFYPSPLRDDGYDIADYVDVNPSYGTLHDFKAFLDAAHQRNMQVLIELVINHTSDQHPWFKAARVAPPGSPAREMYVWSKTDQLYKDAGIIFTDTEKSNWTWDEKAKAYYWHRFFSHQPDLNFDNPAVMEEVLKAMRFWLDMGVDALRMDAIPYLVEREGTSCENLPETHLVVKKIRAAIDAEYANRLILAEANEAPADVRPYFGDGDECHMAFNFPLMPRIYMALRQEDRRPITDIMAQLPPIPDKCQWGLFLRNHDELTLALVSEDERDYMHIAYSNDPRMRVNGGIRRRLAPLVDNNRRRIELLNSLLLSFPGTPILYYGDEIGMGDNIYLGDRNSVRTPMQWNSDRNAGFSKCDPARLFLPIIMDPIYGYQAINVEAQLSDQSSLLHWTRNMIALRKLFQVFGRGTLSFLNPANRKILAYLRDLDRGDGSHETVLCVANLSRFAQPVSLDLTDHKGAEPVEMLGYVPFPTITEAPIIKFKK